MKDSKFWIWFIPLLLIICVGIYMMLSKSSSQASTNNNQNTVLKDSKKIKESYDKYNINGYVIVNLKEQNSYSYTNFDEIKDIFNGKDAIIYLGEASSPMARKTITVLDEAISSTSIEKVYYIEVSRIDDEFTNYLKDKLDVKNIQAGTTITVKDGKLLKKYYPNFENDALELTKEEHDLYLKDYQDLITSFIEACNENC